MSIMVRIGTDNYPVAELMAQRYPDLGFDRGRRGKRRRWHRGYWYLLEAEIRQNIGSVEFYFDWGTAKLRFTTLQLKI